MLQEAALPLPTVGLFFTKKRSVSYRKPWKMSTASIPEIPRGRWGHNQPTSSSLCTRFCSTFLSHAVCLLLVTWWFVSLLYEGSEHLSYQASETGNAHQGTHIYTAFCVNTQGCLQHGYSYSLSKPMSYTNDFFPPWTLYPWDWVSGIYKLHSAAFIVLMSILSW